MQTRKVIEKYAAYRRSLWDDPEYERLMDKAVEKMGDAEYAKYDARVHSGASEAASKLDNLLRRERAGDKRRHRDPHKIVDEYADVLKKAKKEFKGVTRTIAWARKHALKRLRKAAKNIEKAREKQQEAFELLAEIG